MSRDLIIILLIVAFDAFVLIPLVMWGVVKVGWSSMQRAYPSRTPSPDALRRNFQSFRFGIMNFGMSVHVAADEACLHLIPARLLRWFGAGVVSVPWESIRITKRHRGRRWVSASFGGRTVLGPAWCLDLAAPEGRDDHQSNREESPSR